MLLLIVATLMRNSVEGPDSPTINIGNAEEFSTAFPVTDGSDEVEMHVEHDSPEFKRKRVIANRLYALAILVQFLIYAYAFSRAYACASQEKLAWGVFSLIIPELYLAVSLYRQYIAREKGYCGANLETPPSKATK